MWYGFTKQNFLGGLRIFCVIGFLTGAVAVAAAAHGPGVRNWAALAGLIFGIPAIWLTLSAILSVTWLKLEDDELAWYLWQRFLLLRCPIEAVESIGSGSFSALVIRTRKGTIRVLGLHASDRGDLIRRLTAANPDIRLR